LRGNKLLNHLLWAGRILIVLACYALGGAAFVGIVIVISVTRLHQWLDVLFANILLPVGLVAVVAYLLKAAYDQAHRWW